MDIRIEKGRLRGAVEVPASKSDAHRLLICAALADGPTKIHIRTGSDDISATVEVLRGLGADIEAQGEWVLVRPIKNNTNDEAVLDCRESGSTLRFLVPVAAALGIPARFTGCGRLPARPMDVMTALLRQHGVDVTGDNLPITVAGTLQSGIYSLRGDVSSQYITGLLLALPLLAGESEIRLTTPLESAGYVEMTLRALARFGVKVEAFENGWRMEGGQRYTSPETVKAEGDWSSAAFWLAANTLGSDIEVKGLNSGSAHGDKAVVNAIEEMKKAGEVVIDATDIPDLVPVLAVCAAARQGLTRFTNCGRLRLKESDRIAAVCDLLNDLGGDARCEEDSILVNGSGTLKGGVADGRGDHRIVMSAAVASAICENPVTVSDAEAVAKSYPAFWEEFQRMGGIFHVI